MSANTTAPLSAAWSGETDRIEADALTLLVADPSQPAGTPVCDGWPIPLDEGAAQALAYLDETAREAGCPANQLRLIGLEFAHPEQYDTTVTLAGSDLEDVIWCFEGIEISGAPAAEIALHQVGALGGLRAIRVPVIG